MSRAFVKEDVDVPDRTRRVRPASGLPPGALNYLTAAGARRLRGELEKLRRAGAGDPDRVAELERILSSATIVEFPDSPTHGIAFGATVTVQSKDGRLSTCRIVGVDEVRLYENAVSWVAPIGRVLLNAQRGDQVVLGEDEPPAEIVRVEFVKDPE